MMNKKVQLRRLTLNVAGVLVWLLLSACTFHNPAPVVDHSNGQARQAQVPTGSYRVQAGDTLFGIAFSYGLDQRDLAAWNGLSEPFTIYPQQLLLLTEPSGSSASTASTGEVKIYKAATPQATTTRTYTTKTVAPVVSTQKPVPPSPEPQSPVVVTQKPVPPSPLPQTPAAQTAPTNAQKPVPPAATTNNPAATSAQSSASSPAPAQVVKPVVAQSKTDPTSWRWPTSGRVLRGFIAGDPARNGVDIGGQEGQAIQATAGGTVVYSGNGLIGYGELIIIKHSDNMLSAYAHNKIRLADEGQQVVAGQKIAEMGRNDRNEQLLHFEIRTRGKPVNPLIYLPKQ